jgi:hypothetical protein
VLCLRLIPFHWQSYSANYSGARAGTRPLDRFFKGLNYIKDPEGVF